MTADLKTHRIASMYGYKYAAHTNDLSEFAEGSNIVVLTKNGQPIMSGKVESVDLPDQDDSYPYVSRVKVAGEWYGSNYHMFRHM